MVKRGVSEDISFNQNFGVKALSPQVSFKDGLGFSGELESCKHDVYLGNL